MARCTYLLPLRRKEFSSPEAFSFAKYFAFLRANDCEVIVADGSDPSVFSHHHTAFGDFCQHITVDPAFNFLNGKLNGVYTGVSLSKTEKIILADDDIRYDAEALKTVVGLLDHHEVVRPQNHLKPLPWWAKIETSRMLINRALLRAADYPGTCAFRREPFLAAGPCDGDVLFDNEELLRHLAHKGCSIAFANDLFIEKRAPTFRKWLEQRPRQAYEDFGLRTKTIFFFAFPLCLIPLLILENVYFRLGNLVLLMVLAMVLALLGRAKGNAASFFPRHCCLFAPVWLVERVISTYVAAYWFLRHGGYPFGDKILSKGIGTGWRAGASAMSAQSRGQ